MRFEIQGIVICFGDNAPVTALVGAQTDALTGWTVAIESIFSGVGRQTVAVSVELWPNDSVGVTYTPKATNSNQDVQLAIAFYIKEDFALRERPDISYRNKLIWENYYHVGYD